MAAETFAAAAGIEVYKGGKGTIKTIAYLKDLKRNYEKLMQEAGELRATKDAICTEISRFRLTPDMNKWIAKTGMIEEEVTVLGTKYEKKQRWRLDCLVNLSRDMAEKCNQVRNHREEGKLQQATLVMELPEPVRKIHTLKLQENSSLHKVVRHVLGFLDDEKIRRIAICGKVGTAKTTIMKNLNNHEKIAEMFHMVIWVSVSKEWSERKLQDAILQRLKLDVQGITDIEEVALIISEELKEKKYLILLDEVWDTIDLNRIMGINDNQKDSKVVLASRYDDVCYGMEVNEIVDVKPLLPTDAWKMFKEEVGDPISNPLIEPIAWCVLEECHGLPLLIDRVAKTFKKKDKNVSRWEDGLRRLQRWDSIKIEGMDEVLERLEICYEDLKDGEEKLCFLYGALYPEESEIFVDYLLECWRAEGFINHANNFKQARNRGHTVLNELIKVSLLERSNKSKCVKMNKVLRKMALRISSQSANSKILVKAHEELEDFPRKEEWELANRISLMDNRVSTLPETVDCHDLLTLLLQRNKYLTSIPELFFTSMCRLQVLDLHGTKISALPLSLSNLISLKALYLNSCLDLIEIPASVEALKHLEVLDIRKTKLNLLQFGSLIWLKCLRISVCNFEMGNHTEAQVSRFDTLEELSIDVGSSKEGWDKIVEMVVQEVAMLKKLTSLQFCFPNVDHLDLFVKHSPVWEKDSYFTFQFSVGFHDSACAQILESIDNPTYNILKLVNGQGVDPVIVKVLMKTNAFGLIGDKGVSSLSAFGIEKMNKMFNCLIDRCHEIKTIVDGHKTSEAALKWLENLYIKNVPKLESIWEGPVHAGSLAQLASITLCKCPELKKIFSHGVIQQLLQLKHLRVEECSQIEEIIMESENAQLVPQALPKLKTLILLDLPRLTRIWANDSLEWPSLQGIEISMCDMLKSLPFNQVNATKLQSIKGQQSWWGDLVWEDDATKQRFQSLYIRD